MPLFETNPVVPIGNQVHLHGVSCCQCSHPSTWSQFQIEVKVWVGNAAEVEMTAWLHALGLKAKIEAIDFFGAPIFQVPLLVPTAMVIGCESFEQVVSGEWFREQLVAIELTVDGLHDDLLLQWVVHVGWAVRVALQRPIVAPRLPSATPLKLLLQSNNHKHLLHGVLQ